MAAGVIAKLDPGGAETGATDALALWIEADARPARPSAKLAAGSGSEISSRRGLWTLPRSSAQRHWPWRQRLTTLHFLSAFPVSRKVITECGAKSALHRYPEDWPSASPAQSSPAASVSAHFAWTMAALPSHGADGTCP